MLTEEETNAIKNQLIEQIERSFPEDKKQFSKQQILGMDAERLEEFLVKNNLIAGKNSQCIFCSIVLGDIPSSKIEENKEAIAVLEINPISKGHCLIIPKKHIKEDEEFPKEAEKLAEKISEKIEAKLKPKRTDILPATGFGHRIINILPIYENETLSSKRQPAKKEELDEVQELLKNKSEPKTQGIKIPKPKKPRKAKTLKSEIKKIEESIKKFEEKLWLPQRIP